MICDDDGVELATHVISYPDGSRIPEAHCDGHMIPWCLVWLVNHLEPDGLMQAIAFLTSNLPDPEPAGEPQQPPESEAPPEPRKRSPRRRAQPTGPLHVVGDDV